MPVLLYYNNKFHCYAVDKSRARVEIVASSCRYLLVRFPDPLYGEAD